MAIDAKDNLHTAYFNDNSEDLYYAYGYGSSWMPSLVDSEKLVGNFNSLAIDNQGKPKIAYFDRTNRRIKFDHLVNNQWRLNFITERNDSGIKNLSLTIDTKNRPYILYYDNAISGLVLSRAMGNTWAPSFVTSARQEGLDAALRIDPSDQLGISFYDHGLKYARSVGADCIIETIESGSGVGVYSSRASDDSGNSHICYHDQTTSNLKYAGWE